MTSNIKLINNLISVLADSQVLLLKTQNYHWNVYGINFKELHVLFEEQYDELNTAIDDIAELIRSLGEKIPASWKDYSQLASITEGNANLTAIEMIKDLYQDQKSITNTIKQALAEAEIVKDDVSIDIMVARLAAHRKNHWMLSSMLQ